MTRRLLVLDVDGTLLHTDPVPGGVEVPGRTRSSYLAPEACTLLVALSHHVDLVFATGRSWDGMRILTHALLQQGLKVAALCLENGGIIGLPDEWRRLEPERNWHTLRTTLDQHPLRAHYPYEWQDDFWSCLVARATTHDEAVALAPLLLDHALRFDADLSIYRDGRKVYLAGAQVNKWLALLELFGQRAAAATGVGDGLNDMCWLSHIALPCTVRSADPQVITLVSDRAGLVSFQHGHAGTTEILRELLRLHTGDDQESVGRRQLLWQRFDQKMTVCSK